MVAKFATNAIDLIELIELYNPRKTDEYCLLVCLPTITYSRYFTSHEGFHPRETSGMTREKLCYLVRRQVDLTSHEGKTKQN